MKVQYRIAKTTYGCFPQIRTKGLLFWGPWMRIGKHIDGYGLYNDLSYPKTLLEAQDLIKAYDAWHLPESDDKVVYIAVQKPYMGDFVE